MQSLRQARRYGLQFGLSHRYAARSADLAMNLTNIALLILTPILVWRVYSRLKTMMARQRSLEVRHWSGLVVLLSILVLVGADLAAKPATLAWLLLGSAAGVAYGIWGLRLTKYEVTPQGYYFKPPDNPDGLTEFLKAQAGSRGS